MKWIWAVIIHFSPGSWDVLETCMKQSLPCKSIAADTSAMKKISPVALHSICLGETADIQQTDIEFFRGDFLSYGQERKQRK